MDASLTFNNMVSKLWVFPGCTAIKPKYVDKNTTVYVTTFLAEILRPLGVRLRNIQLTAAILKYPISNGILNFSQTSNDGKGLRFD